MPARHPEIALRIVVGARQRDILAQSLVEVSKGLSLLRGSLRAELGLAAACAIASLAQCRVLIQPLVVHGSVATAIGVAFGLYPAQRAARLGPIVALRSSDSRKNRCSSAAAGPHA